MIENSIVYRDFKGKYDYFPLARATGSLLWDRNGKRYVDFSSAWNVTNLGWNHPEVAQAVIRQAKRNVQGFLWGSDPVQEEYAAALTAALPKSLDSCVKATGGTESIEMAVKIARVHTKRTKVVGFVGNYHGQLFASLVLGATNKDREKIGPMVPDVFPVRFPDARDGKRGFEQCMAQLESHLAKQDVAAVVCEPGLITGWGSMLVAHPGFLNKVRALTKQYGALLIVDEVGTGFSRTGKLFGIEHDGVVPDMIVFAKAITNGAAALGTVVGNANVFENAIADAVLISTFGWTPVACAAALETLRVHQRDKTWRQANTKGDYLLKKLNALKGDAIVDVRGKGLEIGVQFKDAKTCSRVQKACVAHGLHAVTGNDDTMQLMPPLTIPKTVMDEGLEILTAQLA